MICEQALISVLQSSSRFVSAGGLFEDRWLGYTVATFPRQDKCQLLGAFRSDTVGAAQSARSKEEAFKGHVGDPGAEQGCWTVGLRLAESCVCARVLGCRKVLVLPDEEHHNRKVFQVWDEHLHIRSGTSAMFWPKTI